MIVFPTSSAVVRDGGWWLLRSCVFVGPHAIVCRHTPGRGSRVAPGCRAAPVVHDKGQSVQQSMSNPNKQPIQIQQPERSFHYILMQESNVPTSTQRPSFSSRYSTFGGCTPPHTCNAGSRRSALAYTHNNDKEGKGKPIVSHGSGGITRQCVTYPCLGPPRKNVG